MHLRKSGVFAVISAVSALGVTTSSHAAVIIANQVYNTSGSPGNYTNASSIAVSNSDLINGAVPSATNYVGCCEASGGTTAPLTNGNTGSGASDPTSASNSLFDLQGTQPWYVVYDLGSSTAIGSTVVTTGHQDSRVNQVYDVLVSNDGTNFTSLSDNTSHAVGAAGAGFNYSPSNGNGGAAQSTVLDNASNTLATARYVELVVLDNGNDVFREFDATSPVPEPASLGLLGLAGLLARRRRA